MAAIAVLLMESKADNRTKSLKALLTLRSEKTKKSPEEAAKSAISVWRSRLPTSEKNADQSYTVKELLRPLTEPGISRLGN